MRGRSPQRRMGRGYRHGAGAFAGRGRHARAWTGETTLDRTRPGDEFEIVEVADERARMHALRFGMAEGARVACVTRVPAGPIILRCGRQEIAVGRHLAGRIRVRRAEKDVA